MPGVIYLWFFGVYANWALDCLSDIEIVHVKDILKIAMDAKAFWIHCIDVDKKKKNELDLNKRKLAAVVLSVLFRKQLYLTWSKMSQWCLHREEINAMEATWLLGNEKPECKKGVERRRRRAQCWKLYWQGINFLFVPPTHVHTWHLCFGDVISQRQCCPCFQEIIAY